MRLARRLLPATAFAAAASTLSAGTERHVGGEKREDRHESRPTSEPYPHVRHGGRQPLVATIHGSSHQRVGKRKRPASKVGVAKANSRFFDLDLFYEADRRSLGDMMGQIDNFYEMIDWEAIRDGYTMASLSQSRSRTSSANGDDVDWADDDTYSDGDHTLFTSDVIIEDDDDIFQADFGDLVEYENESETDEQDTAPLVKGRRRLSAIQRVAKKGSRKRRKHRKRDGRNPRINARQKKAKSSKSSKRSKKASINFDDTFRDSNGVLDIFADTDGEDDNEDCIEEDILGNVDNDWPTKSSKSGKSSKSSKSSKSAKSSKSGKSSKSSKGSKSTKKGKGKGKGKPCVIPTPTPTEEMGDGNGGKGFDFVEYTYARGNCPDPGSTGLPCAPDNLRRICDKYDSMGSFRSCLEVCKPSFCCIHDALSPPEPNSNNLAPNCLEDENCAQYSYCYIVWWKLHDTIGPALYLRIEQDDEFYDMEAEEIEGDKTGDPFYLQLLLHHFDDVQQIIEDGTDPDTGEFVADTIFDDPDYWNADF